MEKGNKPEKRVTIKKKISRAFMFLCLATILLSAIIAIESMMEIRDDSETALTDAAISSIAQNMRISAKLGEEKLGVYSGMVANMANFAGNLYVKSDEAARIYVDRPRVYNDGSLVMQRYLVSSDMTYDEVSDEMMLMGNNGAFWKTLMSRYSETVTSLYYASKSGFLIAYDKSSALGISPDGGESIFDYTDREWYVNADTQGKCYFSDVYADDYGRGLMVSCSCPVFADGEYKGVVSADILIQDLIEDTIGMEKKEPGYYSAILNRNGEEIISQGNIADGENFEDRIFEGEFSDKWEAVSAVVNNDGFYFQYGDNFDVFFGMGSIGSSGWYYLSAVDRDTLMEPLFDMQDKIRRSVIIFLVCVALLIPVIYFFAIYISKQLTTPIEALADDVAVISKGELDYRAEILSNDEIGDLAESFNNMAESLDKFIKDLTAVTAEKERIGAELSVATNIQMSMLPAEFPDTDEYRLSAMMDPAKEVGGDFYDFFMLDEKHVAVVVADVSGKGVPAALFMVIGKTLLKTHTLLKGNLSEVFSGVNNLLCENNSESLFITAFEAVIDLETGDVVYVNAGHEIPFIKRKDGNFEQQKPVPGFVLAAMEDMRYKIGTMHLEPGDMLFQYSDGVPEALNPEEEQYGMGRLEKILNVCKDKSPEEMLPMVRADIEEFVAGANQFDDITMLCFEYKKHYEAKGE